MDNSSILISVIIVLCIAAGVTAYGLTNDSNTVFNDLSGFTPDASGDTGIGNNSTNGTGNLGTGTANAGSGSGSGSGSSGGSYSSSSSSSSSSSNSGPTISSNRAKQLAASAARSGGWTGAYCTSATYNSGGYYYCVLRDDAGNTGYALIGSGTGRLLEGAWSKQVTPSPDDVEDDYKDNTTSNSTG